MEIAKLTDRPLLNGDECLSEPPSIRFSTRGGLAFPSKLKHVTFKKCTSYRFKVIVVSPFAETTPNPTMPSLVIDHVGYRPLTVAVESRRGFGGDGSGGTDSGSLFGCSSILSISRLASSHASKFCEADDQ